MKRVNWIFVTVSLLLLFLLFLLIIVSYQGRIKFSMPVYFFLLVVCDLAATAFLTNALKSSAEYDGNVYKGRLKISGAALIFIIILIIGYKYKPSQKDSPFDLTIIIYSAEKEYAEMFNGFVRIELGNNPRKLPIDQEDKAVFTNIDSRYLGEPIPVSVYIEGFRKDTVVTIPDEPLPVIRLPVVKVIDSTLFSGYVFKSNPGKAFEPVSNAVVNFNELDKKVTTDSTGYFRIYLSLKKGSSSAVTVFKSNKWIFSDRITLSNNIQILTHE